MAETLEVEFFFDVGSPYSYLASTQLAGLAQRSGARVRWRPFLLGGVFKATSNDMPARVPARARYMLIDLGRWAREYGAPFRLNSRFPMSTLAAQRALVAAAQAFGDEAIPPFAHALFRAMWVDDRDVGSGDELAFCANAAGLDARTIAGRVDDPSVKAALRDTTDEAVRRGAFGAPTLFVGDAMYFGNDRLAMLEADLGRRA